MFMSKYSYNYESSLLFYFRGREAFKNKKERFRKRKNMKILLNL